MSTPSSRCPAGASMASSPSSSTVSGGSARRSLVTSKPILITQTRPELKISCVSPVGSPSSPLVSSPLLSRSPPKPYIVQKLLGHGSFAKVYLGVDAQSQEPVAIKRVRLLLSEEQKRLKIDERFTREIDMMRIFRHVNIIQYRSDYKTSLHHCCVLEFAPLHWQITTKQLELPLDVIRRRFAQLVSAIYYLYRCHRIAHRDLKPDNLLLTNEGDVRLIDFGLAIKCETKLVSTDTKEDILAKTLCGSPYYMAPELVCDHNTQYNPWVSDMWSLGVILYQTIFGQVPYPVKTIIELTTAIERQPIKYPYECSATGLIRSLLQRDVNKRMTIEDLIYHPFVDLKEWQRHQVPGPLPLYLTIAESAASITSITSVHSIHSTSSKSIPEISVYQRTADHLPRLWVIYRQHQKTYPMLWVPFLDTLVDLLPDLKTSSASPLPSVTPLEVELDAPKPPDFHVINDEYFGIKTIIATPTPPPLVLTSAPPSSTVVDPMLQRWMEPMRQVCEEQKRRITDPLSTQILSDGWHELWKWSHDNAVKGAVHQSQKEIEQAKECFSDCCIAFYELVQHGTREENTHESSTYDTQTIAARWWRVKEQWMCMLGR